MDATHPDVRRNFVHLAANCHLVPVGTLIGHQRKAVLASLHDRETGDGGERCQIIEPSLHDSGASTSHGCVSLSVRWMLGTSLGKSVRHEIRAVLGIYPADCLGVEDVGMQRIICLASLRHVDESAVGLGTQVPVHK